MLIRAQLLSVYGFICHLNHISGQVSSFTYKRHFSNVFLQTKCFSVLSNVITWLKAANLLYCIYLLYADLKSLDNNIMLFKLTIHFILFNSILCCDINGI